MMHRAQDKELAKQYMHQSGNLSGMIGTSILSTVLKTITKTPVLAIVAAAEATIVSLVGSIFLPIVGSSISSLAQTVFYTEMYGGSFGRSIDIGLALIPIVIILLLCVIGFTLLAAVNEAVLTPFDIMHNRYYLYLRQRGESLQATTLLGAYDCFVQFVMSSVYRSILVMWLPLAIQAVAVLLFALFLGIGSITLAAFVLIAGFAAAFIAKLYKGYQYWPYELLQADYPEMSPKELAARCEAMTKGQIFDLFVVDLSFIGWDILNNLTSGLLGILWLSPYKIMTDVLIYEELKGSPVTLADLPVHTGVTVPAPVQVDTDAIVRDVTAKVLAQLPANHPNQPQNPAFEPKLVGVAGMYTGSTIPLTADQPVVLGRDGKVSQVVFSQGAEKISRRHCEIVYLSQSGKYRVTDFSSNGTYVNRNRLPANQPVLLPRGTDLVLGNERNVVRLG